MARAMWSGVIGFGLVSIPIKMFSAVENKNTGFHQIHDVCKTQIKELRWCTTCERKVEWSEIAKGFEYEKGRFVNLTEEDMEKLPLPSKNIINVSSFVKLNDIDPLYYEKSYFLEADKKGEHPFALLSQALTEKGMVGIASITLRSRERLCSIRPFGQTILLNTLYYPDELRIDLSQTAPDFKIPPKELQLATHLIEMLADDFKPEQYTDNYREALKSLLDAKIAGLPMEEQPAQLGGGGRVLDLMASLQASLENAKSKKLVGVDNSPVRKKTDLSERGSATSTIKTDKPSRAKTKTASDKEEKVNSGEKSAARKRSA